MSARDYKEVPIKKVPVGTKFERLLTPSSICMSNFELVELTGAYAKIKSFDREPEVYSTENLFIEVPLTREEKEVKYTQKIEELKNGLRRQLSTSDFMGYHEMWNGSLELDIVEMASTCVEHNMTILGYVKFEKGQEKVSSITGTKFDVGIVAQYLDEEGDIFWCHSSSDWFKYWELD